MFFAKLALINDVVAVIEAASKLAVVCRGALPALEDAAHDAYGLTRHLSQEAAEKLMEDVNRAYVELAKSYNGSQPALDAFSAAVSQLLADAKG